MTASCWSRSPSGIGDLRNKRVAAPSQRELANGTTRTSWLRRAKWFTPHRAWSGSLPAVTSGQVRPSPYWLRTRIRATRLGLSADASGRRSRGVTRRSPRKVAATPRLTRVGGADEHYASLIRLMLRDD